VFDLSKNLKIIFSVVNSCISGDIILARFGFKQQP